MFSFLKRKKKAKKDIFEKGEFNMNNIDLLESHEFLTVLLYANDFVNTIYPACASCYNISEEKNTKYEERLGYIGRRTKTSHTSILEHSNIVLQVFIPLKTKRVSDVFNSITDHNMNITMDLVDYSSTDQDLISMISEVRDCCRYLTIHTDTIGENESPVLRMTIGGSIRGYRYIFETIKNRQNKLFISIFDVLKKVVPSEFFIDYINDGVMEKYDTIDINTMPLKRIVKKSLLNTYITETMDIINMDNLETVSNLLKLDMEDCFDFVTITIDFKKMSRVITQQLTRHRNAITQESQRYVNYTGALFNSPAKFKKKYDKDKVYETSLGNYTLSELGNVMTSVYSELVTQGVEKEDARGYLPQNIQCRKLFMTFTLRTLLAFLHLRLDPHAQAEIRDYALRLSNMTDKYAVALKLNNMEEVVKKYFVPEYSKNNIEDNDSYYTEIDEEV